MVDWKDSEDREYILYKDQGKLDYFLFLNCYSYFIEFVL